MRMTELQNIFFTSFHMGVNCNMNAYTEWYPLVMWGCDI